MKIIFLNCWYGQAGNRFVRFVQENSSNTSIFCFQEIQPELFIKLKALLPEFKNTYHKGSLSKNTNLTYGQAVFVRKNLKLERQYIINLFKNTPRNLGFLQMVLVQKAGKTINIANIHGNSLPGHKNDTTVRLRQSKITIDTFASKKGVKIIGGDFNLNPNTKSVEMFKKSGFKDLIGDFQIKTTRNTIAWRQAKKLAEEGKRVFYGKQHFSDYVFVSPEVKVKSFEVPNIEISDHLPMILDFEI